MNVAKNNDMIKLLVDNDSKIHKYKLGENPLDLSIKFNDIGTVNFWLTYQAKI